MSYICFLIASIVEGLQSIHLCYLFRPAVTNHTAAVATTTTTTTVPVESITEQKLTNLMQKANQNLEKGRTDLRHNLS